MPATVLPLAGRILRNRCVVALAVSVLCGATAVAQPATPAGAPRRITIPYLANDTRPADLDFAAAQCELSPDGRQMSCDVRQLFVTVTAHDPSACAVTTNGYAQTFTRESPTRWTSASAPQGRCGVIETTTLEDGGTTRWTMTIRRLPTVHLQEAACSGAPEVEVYSWKQVQRALPCRTLQPGAIER